MNADDTAVIADMEDGMSETRREFRAEVARRSAKKNLAPKLAEALRAAIDAYDACLETYDGHADRIAKARDALAEWDAP